MLDFKLSIILFVFLLAIGGLFVYVDFQETQEQEKSENIAFNIEEETPSVISSATAEEEEIVEEESPFSDQGEELISQSEILIGQIKDFIEKEREKLEQVEAAERRARNAKGIYMTGFVANSLSGPGNSFRQNLVNLIQETELNSIVIDVKEVHGPYMPASLKNFIEELHQKNIWVIARIVAFKDSSLIEENPELYLKSATNSTAISSSLWTDYGGGYWLDPASQEAQDYLIEFSKKAIDLGFDELQFDYVRFPSDGNLSDIIYPFYSYEEKKKHEVMRDFFSKITQSLKEYKPSIILSVDLFGYVAGQLQSLEIGQRVIDVADNFDYISFMLYPSHFYDGFIIGADSERELPALFFKKDSDNIEEIVSSNPYQVVFRSLLSVKDYLASIDSEAKLRPWLQDFNLKADTDRGIVYDAEKVKAQIQASIDAGTDGWLLWSAANVYTKEALNPTP